MKDVRGDQVIVDREELFYTITPPIYYTTSNKDDEKVEGEEFTLKVKQLQALVLHEIITRRRKIQIMRRKKRRRYKKHHSQRKTRKSSIIINKIDGRLIDHGEVMENRV